MRRVLVLGNGRGEGRRSVNRLAILGEDGFEILSETKIYWSGGEAD